jgi:hypothetical protein
MKLYTIPLFFLLSSLAAKSQSFHLESVPDSINNVPKFSIWMTEDNIYPKVIVNRWVKLNKQGLILVDTLGAILHFGRAKDSRSSDLDSMWNLGGCHAILKSTSKQILYYIYPNGNPVYSLNDIEEISATLSNGFDWLDSLKK